MVRGQFRVETFDVAVPVADLLCKLRPALASIVLVVWRPGGLFGWTWSRTPPHFELGVRRTHDRAGHRVTEPAAWSIATSQRDDDRANRCRRSGRAIDWETVEAYSIMQADAGL